jgi:hypothetical protein
MCGQWLKATLRSNFNHIYEKNSLILFKELNGACGEHDQLGGTEGTVKPQKRIPENWIRFQWHQAENGFQKPNPYGS